MKTIWKFTLQIVDDQLLAVPVGFSQPLCCQFQRGVLCLWAMVNIQPDDKPAARALPIRIVGTGKSAEMDGWEYLATVQEPPESWRYGLVWHVFADFRGFRALHTP